MRTGTRTAAGAMPTVAEAIALIEAATGPAELFGGDGARRYRRLARLIHPDARPGDARAAAAFVKLAALWERQADAWRPGSLVSRGDLANLYRAGGGLLKVPRSPADNDLMEREAAALGAIARDAPRRLRAYFPVLTATRQIADPLTGAQRRANLLEELDGFVTLAQVRAAFPDGVDQRDAAWMWRRLLVAIGAAHRAGVVHGAVLPGHVLIHPAKHGLVLVDWCYSGRPGGRLPAVVARYRRWYPPEVLDGQPAGPDCDIWLATRCMAALTGGRLGAQLAAFARGCVLPNPRRRPRDAWQLLGELDELLERLYGPRTFRPFAMPAQGS